jgi:YbbR domain-containing protein
MLSLSRSTIIRYLLSLALSITLWSVVTASENPERVDWFPTRIPIETRGLPQGLVIKGEIAPVRLRIAAPRESWSRLQESNFVAYVNLSGAEPGVREAEVRVEVSDPRVRVLGIDRPRVPVRIEPLKTVTVPVRVQIQGNVALGYRLEEDQVKVTPDRVTVSGPASVVDEVTHVNVNVRIEGERSSVTVSRRPVPQNRLGGDVAGITNLEPQTVEVVVPIRQVASYKTVSVVADVRGQPAPGFIVSGITVTPGTVTILGEPRRVEDITTISTSPIDISGATGTLERQASLVRPPNVSLEVEQPVTVRVQITSVPASTTVRLAVVLDNPPSGLVATVNPTTVEVTLSGPSPLLQQVDRLLARIDAAQLTAGTHTVSPQVTVPDGVNVVRMNPAQVTLTLAPAG